MPGLRWPFDHSLHSAQPPVMSTVEDYCETLSLALDLDKVVSRVSDGCHPCAGILGSI